MGKSFVGIDEEVYAIFEDYSWPGNIRELENIMDRAIAVADTSKIRACDLPASLQGTVEGRTEGHRIGVARDNGERRISELERDCLQGLLEETGGNLREVARRMGIARSTVYNKMRSYRIPVQRYRS
jgi:DNA-binding NtrC family response regulator